MTDQHAISIIESALRMLRASATTREALMRLQELSPQIPPAVARQLSQLVAADAETMSAAHDLIKSFCDASAGSQPILAAVAQ